MLKHQHLFYRKVRFKRKNTKNIFEGTIAWVLGIGETDEGILETLYVCVHDEPSFKVYPNDIEILDEYNLEKKAEAEERRKNRDNTIRVRVDEHGAGHIVNKEDDE